MIYTSFRFLFFLALVALFYFTSPHKMRWIILLIASYTFYLLADWRYFFFILITTISTYLTGRLLDKNHTQSRAILDQNPNWNSTTKRGFRALRKKQRKYICLIALLINLGILFFIIYFIFIAVNINIVLAKYSFGALPIFSIFLPLGISFYTFQSLGYVIDVSRGRTKADRNIAKLALFISFFPQIVQGPISRHDQLAHQLYQPHDFDFKRMVKAAELIIWGFFLKLVIADRIAIISNELYGNYTEYRGIGFWIAGLAYGLQIYCDFSGGITISQGVAQLFGIQLVNNFERPYFSTSLAEFWRRWHITLGAWMRDYFFYPVSLSSFFSRSLKRSRQIFGPVVGKVIPSSITTIFLFLLVGVWHGASWNFILYGLWNGLIISFAVIAEPLFAKATSWLRINKRSKSYRIFCMIRTLAIVSVGRMISNTSTLKQAFYMLRSSFSQIHLAETVRAISTIGLNWLDYLILALGIALLIGVGMSQEKGIVIRDRLEKSPAVLHWLFVFSAIIFIMLFGIYGIAFDSSSFIYQGF